MRERSVPSLLAGWVLALLLGCRGETVATPGSPAPATAPAISTPPSATAVAAPVVSAPVASAAAPVTTAAPTAASPPAATVAELEPPLVGADGTPLPQTEERPSLTSERFKRRMQQLADSILAGNGERGRATFFPLVAYAQVKDVQKPERDYRYRLLAHFDRDVLEYRKALGKAAEGAVFLGAEVPEARAQWMAPGKEGNRIGYYRVLRSKLRFRLASGAERTFELTSMISWRGEWYVVHLHGFE